MINGIVIGVGLYARATDTYNNSRADGGKHSNPTYYSMKIPILLYKIMVPAAQPAAMMVILDTPQNLGNLSFWWEKNENVDF